MNEKAMLWLILLVAGATLYISYRTATGLQDASAKVQGVLKNPILGALGL